MLNRQAEKIRELSANELGISASSSDTLTTNSQRPLLGEIKRLSEAPLPMADENDPNYLRVVDLLADGFGGVIFSGPPGTGKSYAARQIAARLVDGNRSHLFFVQFHPAYQYEDFIEAYTPTEDGGFVLTNKVFLRACDAAIESGENVVIVLDELTRTDVIRVFGETFTYLEPSKRELPFLLASGREIFIPGNLKILATMNPWDRGVEELDLAFERRFAKIACDPDVEGLKRILQSSSLSDLNKQRLERFFMILQRHANPLCRLGHAYFQTISDKASLGRLWENQLSFHFDRVLKRNAEELTAVRAAWNNVITDQNDQA